MKTGQLKAAREKAGLTMTQMAVAIAVPLRLYVNYELGFAEPSKQTLMRMALVLRISVSELVDLETLTEDMLSPFERQVLAAMRSGLTVEDFQKMLDDAKQGK